MFEYWKKIDTLHHHNRLLLAFIGCLLILTSLLTVALISMPKRYEFWLAPTMSANGGIIASNEISNEYVHGFVTSLLPMLNSWSHEGKEEFSEHLRAFHHYFTPRHEALLKNTFAAYQNAELFNRTQIASLYRFMEPQDVQKIGKDLWEVKLILRLTQRLKDTSAMVIADKVVTYHIRVVKIHISPLENPFQLALDGYTKPEERVQDLLIGDPS